MLRRTTLTSAQQRELRRWQTHGDPRRARPARLVLWSARARLVRPGAGPCGGCRRTVRRGRHAFRAAGLAGRHSDPSGRASRRGNGARSATAPGDAPCEGRRLPVVPLAVPAVRRLLAVQWFRHAVSPDHVWPWSTWRRYKQALAKRSHYKKRGATPPEFDQVRLEYCGPSWSAPTFAPGAERHQSHETFVPRSAHDGAASWEVCRRRSCAATALARIATDEAGTAGCCILRGRNGSVWSV